MSEWLRTELGIAPSRETRAIGRRLREESDEDDVLSLPAAMCRAGAAAARINAHSEAAGLYERAAGLLDENVTSALRVRCEALLGLGEARLRAGDAGGVREPMLEAAGIARRLADADLLAGAAVGLASVPFFPGHEAADAEALALLEEALRLMPRSDRAGRARLLARIARERYFVATATEVERSAAKALELARASGDPRALGDALDTLHLGLAGAGDTDQRLALADEMIDLGQRAGIDELCLRGHVLRGVATCSRRGTKTGWRARVPGSSA